VVRWITTVHNLWLEEQRNVMHHKNELTSATYAYDVNAVALDA
jgi:hypothetical protein